MKHEFFVSQFIGREFPIVLDNINIQVNNCLKKVKISAHIKGKSGNIV